MRILILILLLALVTNAQTIVEKLSDGYIVNIDGTEYRAINAEKMREVVKTKEERDSYKKYSESLEMELSKVRILSDNLLESKQKEFSIALEKEKKNTEFWKQEYDKEHSLRLVFESDLKRCVSFLFGTKFCWF